MKVTLFSNGQKIKELKELSELKDHSEFQVFYRCYSTDKNPCIFLET